MGAPQRTLKLPVFGVLLGKTGRDSAPTASGGVRRLPRCTPKKKRVGKKKPDGGEGVGSCSRV